MTGKPSLLVVDDDPLITDTLAFALGTDYEVLTVDSRQHAVELLRQLARPPGLALVDLGLPPTPHSPEEGFRLIADLLAHSPAMKIFVLSGQNDAANARHARALGAWEFIAKPSDPVTLKRVLERATRETAPEAAELIGASAPMEKLRSQIAQFAPSPFPVLIEGESGSGKELVAQSLHRIGQTGHLERFNPAVRATLPLITQPMFFEVHRLSVFTPRSLDVDVVLDAVRADALARSYAVVKKGGIVVSITGEPDQTELDKRGIPVRVAA